jgi:gluconolactonase
VTIPPARTVATGVGFGEGPIITADGDIVFTSIDQGALYRVRDGACSVLATTGGGPNGACEIDGEFYIAQNGGNWMVGSERGAPPPPAQAGVQSVSTDGASIRYLSTAPLAPNDLCPGPDGWLYVTDPTRRRTYDDGRIWRIDPSTGESQLLYEVSWFPNGIAFGLDDDVMYVASTGAQQIVRLPIAPASHRVAGETAIQMSFGYPDGMAFDLDGNLLVCALSKSAEPGEIQVWDTRGTLLDRYSPGSDKRYTNVALSGDRTLIITDSNGGSLLATDWEAPGLALFPRRHTTRSAPPIGFGA